MKRIFLLAFLYFGAQAIIVGSNSAVSVQSNITFPATDSNNTMLGYAAFSNGFTLSGNGTTTATYSDYFPITGTVDMRGGLLNLSADLTFAAATTFLTTGSFNGQNRTIYLPFQDTVLPIPSAVQSGNANLLSLLSTQAQTLPVMALDWSFGSTLITFGTYGAAPFLGVVSFNGISMATQSTLLTTSNVDSVRWSPLYSYFATGQQQTAATYNNDQVYSYNNGTLTLTGVFGSGLIYDGNGVAWTKNGSLLAIARSGPSAPAGRALRVATFNPSTGAITASNALLPPTNFVSNNSIDWIGSSTNFWAVGLTATGTDSNLPIYYFDGTNVTTTIALNYSGASVTAVSCCPTGTFIAVGLSGTTNNINVAQFLINSWTLTDIPAAHVGETQNVLSMHWSPDGTKIAVGLVNSANETEVRVYGFNQSTGVLTLLGWASSPYTINVIRWAPNGCYIATGDTGNLVSVYSACLTSANVLVLENTKVVCNSDVQINAPVLCIGNVTFEGNNYNIDLTNCTSFVINPGATVLFKNLTMTGINDSILTCADNTGTLKLQNTTVIQNGSYTFSKGALTIDGDCMFTGSSLFIYSSSQASTINSNAVLMFDAGMTFSYVSATNNKLVYADSTGILYFNQATLYASVVGLALTKGILAINGACTLLNDGATLAGGVSIGDGASAANDVTLRILPESGLNIKSGFFVQKNV